MHHSDSVSLPLSAPATSAPAAAAAVMECSAADGKQVKVSGSKIKLMAVVAALVTPGLASLKTPGHQATCLYCYQQDFGVGL